MADGVRMADIARRLGISTVSVSKALSGDRGVSEELRSRVRETAIEMGYQVSPRRRTERSSRSIGVLIPARYLDSGETFYWRLYQEVIQQASPRDCLVVLELLEDSEAESGELPRLCRNNRAEGLIIIGKPPCDYARRVKDGWERPVVYLDFYDNSRDADAVVSSGYFGTGRMTEYLIGLGHREIGFVGTLGATDSITDRYWGYRSAMDRHQLPVRQDWLLPDRDTVTGRSLPIALPKELPTAFVCNNDAVAVQLIGELEERGLRVPEDVSVAGYDDFLPASSRWVQPTTWAADTREMARLAVRLLCKRLDGERFRESTQISGGYLVEGETTAPVRSQGENAC